MPPSVPFLHSIQVLRGLAALAVALFHLQLDIATRLGLPDALPDLAVGAAGVDVFFVVSGVVMVLSSDRLFGQPGAARSFMARRAIRLVPLYWLTTVFALASAPQVREQTTLPVLAAALAFIPWPDAGGATLPVHAIGWTLNYEMFFYVLFATALALPRRQAVASLMLLLVALIAAGLALRPQNPALQFWTAPIIGEFALGMAIGLAHREGLRLPRPAAWGLVAAGLALFLIQAAPAATHLMPPAERALTFGLPAALLVAGAVLRAPVQHPLPFSRFLAWLGDASYSLYLTHPFVIALARRVAQAGGLDPTPWVWAYAALVLVGCILVAAVCHALFERPVTRALRGFGGQPRPAGPA
ncbi:acyltransferase family protein [Pseudoroseomonas globiformis]|uniref:Acyltransferase family protein n=1 Tax=Teichococcus globiformis TaxID=2307229 RepID=A0ABV7FV82_9PROT